MALLTVNAFGCAPKPRRGPDLEPRPWTEFLGTPTRAPSATESLGQQPHRVWTAETGPGVAGGIAIGDSVIAIQATDRHLTVLWRSSGERAWRSRLGSPGTAGPLLTGSHVFAATGGVKGGVYAYTLGNGRRVWSRRIGPVHGPLAKVGSRVFAATDTGWLYALDADRGSVVWRRRLGGASRNGVVAAGQRVAVATDDSLYLVDPADGRIAAAAATRGTVYSPPALTDDLVVVSSPDGFVAAFGTESLAERWRVETDAAVFGSPAIARDTVFAVTIAGSLWSIPLASPQEAHFLAIGAAIRAPPTPIAGGVLVGTLKGVVLFMDAGRHGPRWRLEADGPIEQPIVLDQGDLVIADGSGKVHLWR